MIRLTLECASCLVGDGHLAVTINPKARNTADDKAFLANAVISGLVRWVEKAERTTILDATAAIRPNSDAIIDALMARIAIMIA